MDSIYSKIIGSLKKSEVFEEGWTSEAIDVPFFDNQRLVVEFIDYEPSKDLNFLDEADLALREFFKKGAEERLSISHLVFRNFKDFATSVSKEDVPKAMRDIREDSEIWKYVDPLGIHVIRRHNNDKDIYISVNCNCDWESEHGLQLVFRKGRKITRVSQIDGHITDADAYGKDDNEDSLLREFEN